VGLLADSVLCLDGVGDGVGQGAIVPDGTRDDVGHVVLNTLVHHTRIDETLVNGRLDAAGADDLAYRVDVVFVALARVVQCLGVDPE